MASMACRAALPRLALRPPIWGSPAPSRFKISCPSSNSLYAFRCQAHSDATSKGMTELKDDISSKTWKIKMLYDGDCPLCMREVNMLKERNRSYGAIKFVDISSNTYSPEENEGLDYERVMGRIHAILSDGTVVRDVEAFRRLYEEVGLGWVYTITKYEPVSLLSEKQATDESKEAFEKLLEKSQDAERKIDEIQVSLLSEKQATDESKEAFEKLLEKSQDAERKIDEIQMATIANAIYSVWAKYRLQITGRPPLEDILESRRKQTAICEDDKVCRK